MKKNKAGQEAGTESLGPHKPEESTILPRAEGSLGRRFKQGVACSDLHFRQVSPSGQSGVVGSRTGGRGFQGFYLSPLILRLARKHVALGRGWWGVGWAEVRQELAPCFGKFLRRRGYGLTP